MVAASISHSSTNLICCTSADPSRGSGLPGSPLPREGSALVQQIKFVEECEIEAATTGSAAAALRALRSHPLVDSVTVAQDLLAGYRAAHPGLAYLR